MNWDDCLDKMRCAVTMVDFMGRGGQMTEPKTGDGGQKKLMEGG